MKFATGSIWRLVDGGDWACSWGEPTGLEQVCNELAEVLDPSLSVRARDVARLASVDMAAASRQWCDLVASLRDVGRHPTLSPAAEMS